MSGSTVNDSGLGLTHAHFEVTSEGVAVVLLDVQGESMNTLSTKVSDDLRTICAKLESDDAIRAAVIGSAKKGSFVAGADINMLADASTVEEAEKLSRDGQEGMARIEALYSKLGKPVVAAIDGPALGGGLELALACSMRICSNSPKTIMAVPEVQLGLLPGAGGTQRLPRLVGVAKGLDMMLTGRNIRAKKARSMGLVDEVVPASILLDVAKKRAVEAADGKFKPTRGFARFKKTAAGLTDPDQLQQLALEENPLGLRVLFRKATEQTLKTTKGHYPAPEAILEVVREGALKGEKAGYELEAKRFGELVRTDVAGALMSIFFATQDLKKDNGTANPDEKGRPVDRIGVLGGGLMGAGIAAVSVTKAKSDVRVKEISNEGVNAALKYVRGILAKGLKRKIYRNWDVNRIMNRITGTTTIAGFESIPLVVEAVFEDLGLKQRLLKEVEDSAVGDTIFASNTSALPIGDIAKGSAHPERVIGMHYFSPVEKMPLLEIIVTDETADWVTATCVEYGRRQGKVVIVVRDGVGFYTSRILAPFMNEAAWALSEGSSVQQLDKALTSWGFPVGPITLLDEVGIDVGSKVAGIMHEAFGGRIEAPDAMAALLEDGRKGRKSDKGFYLYEKGKKGAVDESVYGILGVTPGTSDATDDELQDRLVLQMVNEAALCLQEGILRSARDGDVGAIFGLGFPPYTGGPFTYIDNVGADKIVERLDGFAARFGERFTAAQILRDYASEGKKFRD
jgi:3-hydroxyacyl-CoA dehydrogenase/enoyl-CoA hydratase/3-hydroxybutyryl-CoA epimerase